MPGANDPVARVNGLKLLFLLHRGEREGHDLLDSGNPVYVDQQDSQGRCPLSEAVKRGQVTMIKRLLDLTADPNFQDVHGNTVLMYAVTHGNSTAVELLMKTGIVNVNIRNKQGKKAVDLVEDTYGGLGGYVDSGYVRELLLLGEALYIDHREKVASQIIQFFREPTWIAVVSEGGMYARRMSRTCVPRQAIPAGVVDLILAYHQEEGEPLRSVKGSRIVQKSSSSDGGQSLDHNSKRAAGRAGRRKPTQSRRRTGGRDALGAGGASNIPVTTPSVSEQSDIGDGGDAP